MASEVYINIKDLPELTEINNGEYIIVETSTGTHIINFENFLLPINNTVITTTVNQNASAFNTSVTDLSLNLTSNSIKIDTLSTNLTTVSALATDLNSNASITDSTISTLSTNLNTLSTSYNTFKNTLNSISNTYISKIQITIPIGSNQESGVVTLDPTYNYGIHNILISPANKYASTYSVYPSVFNTSTGLITLKGVKFIPSLSINFALSTASVSSTESVNFLAEEPAIYNVFVIKT